jgi:Adaptor complexes medium subunit family
VGRYPRDKAPELTGTLHLGAGCTAQPIECCQATLSFTVPNATVSGISVKDLLLTGEKYKFFKGVKTLFRTGRYQVRT